MQSVQVGNQAAPVFRLNQELLLHVFGLHRRAFPTHRRMPVETDTFRIPVVPIYTPCPEYSSSESSDVSMDEGDNGSSAGSDDESVKVSDVSMGEEGASLSAASGDGDGDGQVEEPAPVDGKVERTPDLGWIAVTHVCRRWRQAALDCPWLWSEVTFAFGLRWAQEMFNRAKSNPVHIFLVPSRSFAVEERIRRNMCEAALLAQHMHHIRDLIIVNLGGLADIVRFLPSLNEPAPLLEVLELRLQRPKPVGEPLKLFCGHAPNLRRVLLEEYDFSWALLHGCRLTHLAIHSSPSGHQAPAFSYDELLLILEGMDSLVSLDFAHLPPMLGRPARERTIHLPRLKRLHLGGDLSTTIYLFTHLRMPPAAKINITFIDGSSWTDYRAALPMLRNHFRAGVGTCAPFQALAVRPDSHTIWISARRSCPPPEVHPYVAYDSERNNGADVDFSWDVAHPVDAEADTLIREVCETLAPMDIQALYVTPFEPLERADSLCWWEMFGKFEHVEHLTIFGTDLLLGFLDYVNNEDYGDRSQFPANNFDNLGGGSTGRPVIFPNLTRLSIREAILDYWRFKRGDEDYFGTLSRRYRHTSLQILEVQRCELEEIDESFVGILQRFTHMEILWDGILHGFRRETYAVV